MKSLLLALTLLFGLASAQAVTWAGHFSGALWSTRCPVPVGAQITFDVSPNGVMHATVTDDGVVTSQLAGSYDAHGHFRMDDGSTVLRGIIRFHNQGRYIVILGTALDESCAYKFQARFRHF